MEALLWTLVFIFVVSLFLYKNATAAVSAIGLAVLLLLLTVLGSVSVNTLLALWVLLSIFTLLFVIKPMRRNLISKIVMRMYKQSIPTMSETEKEALSAGDLDWTAEIFSGKLDWTKHTELYRAVLSDEEQAFLAGPVESLCHLINDWEIYRHFTIPENIWDHLKQHGFFGLIIPKEYGGLAFSALAHSQIIAKIASCSVAVATVVCVPNSLGPAELLLHYGTQEQKNHYLPRLAKGEDIPCFALTSPVAGSDAGSIIDYGIVVKKIIKGEEKIGINLTWDKRYITLSPVATLLGLAFKLFDPEKLLSDRVERGITCALVPVSTPGVIIGRRHYPLCSAFPNGPTQGKEVFIPLDYIIGGAQRIGQGWRMLMECLAAGRAISIPAIVAGGSKKNVLATSAYARIRRQFNTHIGNFGGVQEALCRVGCYGYLIEALRLFTVAMIDGGSKPVIASAICKYHSTQFSRSGICDAMDIHGGKGICMGPKNVLAQTYIENPIGITVEGANILTRSMIIFGQGAMRAHPYLLREIDAVNANDLIAFDEAIFSHMGHIGANKVRAFYAGLTGLTFTCVPKRAFKKYYRQASRFAAAFAYTADLLLLTLGAKLKRLEKLSGRLGDILSYLYIICAILKYDELENLDDSKPMVEWLCQDLFFKIQTQFQGLMQNLPWHLRFILRTVVFPLGHRFKPPQDQLTKEVASLLMQPSRLRDRLGQHAYVAENGCNHLGEINRVLKEVIEVSPLQKKLYLAMRDGIIKGNGLQAKIQSAVDHGIFSQEEKNLFLRVNEACMNITNVDDFDLESLRGVK